MRLTAMIMTCLFILAALSGCNGSSDSEGEQPTVFTIDLAFERLPPDTLSPFRVTATLRKDGEPMTGEATSLDVEVSQGNPGTLVEISSGVYSFDLTPVQTGEHQVTLTYRDVSVSRTALVLETVDPDWGQPMMVEGLVNTPGYEDGVTITPDGEYLFVQYGPIYFSAIHLFDLPRNKGGCGGERLIPTRCSHVWLDTAIGPYAAPERPGFFDGRISAGTMLHNANSWGVGLDQAPNLALSTMFYGFHRQADGSFAEPFYLAFNDVNDGLIGPYGLSFMLHGGGAATVIFTIDDPSDPDWVDLDADGNPDVESYFDVYSATITFGQNNILGNFVASDVAGTPPVRSTPFPAQLVDFGKTGPDGIAGTQGNSHLYQVDGVVRSIWTDDEYDGIGDYGEISVYFLNTGDLSNGDWSKVVLPAVVNQPDPSREIQPFFTGERLYFTRDSDIDLPQIFYSTYSGNDGVAGYGDSANWALPVKVLGVGPADDIGEVLAIGEPTIANRDGQETLYFVYAIVRDANDPSGIPDINMQAGYIDRR